MKELTFKGFLKKYIKSLSGADTLSIKRLTQEVLPTTSRIAEPLYLYATLTNQHERLLALTTVEYYRKEYGVLNARFPLTSSLVRALEIAADDLPTRYQKVFNTYMSIKAKAQNDRDFCKQTRVVIRTLQTDMNISNYRIYKDLRLNPGNINDYLSNGALKHISRQTVNRILVYLQQWQQNAA